MVPMPTPVKCAPFSLLISYLFFRATTYDTLSFQLQENVRGTNEPDSVILFDAEGEREIEERTADTRNSITLSMYKVLVSKAPTHTLALDGLQRDDRPSDHPPAYITVER